MVNASVPDLPPILTSVPLPFGCSVLVPTSAVLCPNCRQPYSKSKLQWQPPNKKAVKEEIQRQKRQENPRRFLRGVLVVRRSLVAVFGLTPAMCKESLLRQHQLLVCPSEKVISGYGLQQCSRIRFVSIRRGLTGDESALPRSMAYSNAKMVLSAPQQRLHSV